MDDSYLIAVCVTVVVMGLAAAYFYARPFISRNKACRMKPGDQSATPIAHTNPKSARKDEFVDIMSEPNEFLPNTRR
jgi:hypothetical protein